MARNGAVLPNVLSESGRQFGMWKARKYPGLDRAESDALYEVWESAWAMGAWAALRDNSELGLLVMQMLEKIGAFSELVKRMREGAE